eukprot:scaffold7714_cov390-Prasinococcus_capsulatus_cf.AAC.11
MISVCVGPTVRRRRRALTGRLLQSLRDVDLTWRLAILQRCYGSARLASHQGGVHLCVVNKGRGPVTLIQARAHKLRSHAEDFRVNAGRCRGLVAVMLWA